MDKNKKEELRKTQTRRKRHARENRVTRKITGIIVAVVICIVAIVGISAYNTISYNLQPYDSNATQRVEVSVSSGTTVKGLAQQLEDMGIIRSATLFNFYLKTKDFGGLQAGNYALSPSMSLDEIIAVLKEGGTSEQAILATVLVREGDTIDTIAQTVQTRTGISKETFLEAVNDEVFVNELVAQYPALLTSMTQASGLKYKLEGYLFPATYNYRQNDDAKALIRQMVQKTNSVMSSYYEAINNKQTTVHQVLTIASLAEREGVTSEDRRKIVSVFENRLAVNMPLQSDISVLYALGEHKELVTYADLEVDSPYNLYKNVGYGPGPFNSPSEDAIAATLNPESTDYLYFVADVKTGIVYYARTYEEHMQLVNQYVNN